MDKVKSWFSHVGEGKAKNPFQELVDHAAEGKSLDLIEQSVKQYLDFYESLNDNDLLSQPISKECVVLITLVAPHFCSYVNQHKDAKQFFKYLNSASVFIPKRSDMSDVFGRIMFSLIGNQENGLLNQSERLLNNMLNNNAFLEYATTDEILNSVYSITPPSPILFKFLRNAILKSSISSTKPVHRLIESIGLTINTSPPESIYVIGALYKKIGKIPDFEQHFTLFNEKVVELKDITFYTDILKIQTQIPDLVGLKFSEMSIDAPSSILHDIIVLVQKNPIYIKTLSFLPHSVKDMSVEDQKLYLTLVSQQKSDFRKTLLSNLFPPWKFRFDCSVLIDFVCKCMSSDEVEEYTTIILAQTSFDSLKANFSTYKGFQDLLITMFNNINNYDSIEIYYNKIVQVIINGQESALISFDGFCRAFPPVTFIDSLLVTLDELQKSPKFIKTLQRLLIESTEIRLVLLCEQFITWVINNKHLDLLAILAIDGPHEIIDSNVIKMYDEKFSSLTQEQLRKLTYAELQESNEKNYAIIRIPSLIPKLKSITFSSIFDRYSAGKYLIEKNYITFESPILPEVGVQYLTEEFAEKAVDNPTILAKLTNPEFPHTAVIQFQEGREGSYITLGRIPISFYFRIDEFKSSFLLFSAGGFDFRYDQEKLTSDGHSFKLSKGLWHKISIYLEDDKLDLFINDERVLYTEMKNKRSAITIGSQNSNPGSTFYLKSQLEMFERGSKAKSSSTNKEKVSYQTGGGILNIDYNGISIFAPIINLVPRLIQKLMDEKDPSTFSLYLECLLNSSLLGCVSLTMANFLGFIKVILSQRTDVLTTSVVKMCFDFCNYPGKMNWQNFSDLFIDYKIWTESFDVVSSIIPLLANTKRNNQYSKKAARILHFFIDLIIHCGIKDEDLENLIIDMIKTKLTPPSALIIYIISNDSGEFAKKLVQNIPDILVSVPFNLISTLTKENLEQYIRSYAILCSHNEPSFNQKEFDKFSPILSDFVENEQFWISMFILLAARLGETLDSFNLAQIQRPSMLKQIIEFICVLFRKNQSHELLSYVVLTLCSMIESTRSLLLSDYIIDFQKLLHFGVTTAQLSTYPVYFTTFEQCRMPADFVDNSPQIIDVVDGRSNDSSFKLPSTEDFLVFDELWFGLTPTPFIDACNSELLKSDVLSTKNISSQKNSETVESNRILESSVLPNIISLCIRALKELKGEALARAIKTVTVFGSDVDPDLTISLHQRILLRFLNDSPAAFEILKLLRSFVVIGWWEHRLSDLFNTVCESFGRFTGFPDDPEYNERWNAYGILIVTIMSLTTDFSQFKFYENLNTIFSKELLSSKQYHLFMLHMFASNSINVDNLNSCWSNFLNVLGTMDNSTLSSIYEGIFQVGEVVSDRMNDVSIMSSRFTSNPVEYEEEINQIRAKSLEKFNYLTETSNKVLKQMNETVSELRIAYRGESGDALKTRISKIYEFSEKVKQYCSNIEFFQFKTRFNIISHKKERSAYHLWCLLPKSPNGKYQLCPTVHPLSTPLLFVPCSSQIDLSKAADYYDYSKTKSYTNINDIKIQHSFIPPTLSRFVSMPFFPIESKLYDFMFRSSYFHYNGIKRFTTITIVYGTTRVTCALGSAESGFYIITEAGSKDGRLVLEENQSNIAVTTFLDSIAYKYYGSASLFFGHCVLFMSAKHVVNCVKRNYCHDPIAVELWFARGYSLFFVFETQKIRDDFVNNVNHREFFPISDSFFGPTYSTRVANYLNDKNSIKKLTNEWVLGKISSLTYLGILNFLADRSFSNFCQYPVMPWIIGGRDLSKPMGQQDPQRALSFDETFASSAPDLHFYGSHYSSAAVVMHFLLRIQPFSNLHFELHNGFDHRDRLFADIDSEYHAASCQSSHNVEELIPEFFLLPEFLHNTNKIPVPISTRGKDQSSITIPSDVKNSVDFVWKLRKQLDEIEGLENWIDLIFGCNSRGENAKLHKNLFYPSTYGVYPSLVGEGEAFEQMKRCFGQTPTQLFTEAHPAKNTIMFKRTTLLADADAIMMQKLNTKIDDNVSDPIICMYLNHIHITSSVNHFSNLKHSSIINYNDGLMEWQCNINTIVKSSFSFEKLLFCAALSRGSMIFCRSLCNSNGEITGYYTLSSAAAPVTDSHEIRCCAISSHHYVAAEIIGNTLYTFHVGTGLMIRSIELKSIGKAVSIVIDDSFGCFIVFFEKSVEVWTLNGTFVGMSEFASKTLCACIACNDVSSTSASCHEDGFVRLWSCDASKSEVLMLREIKIPFNDAITVELARSGSILICASKSGVGCAVSARGAGVGFFSKNLPCECAKCGAKGKLSECQSCGLYYCSNCVMSNAGTICNDCLDKIEECADIDF